MGDGYGKRLYARVYESPHVGARGPRFQALRADLAAMRGFEGRASREEQARVEWARKCRSDLLADR